MFPQRTNAPIENRLRRALAVGLALKPEHGESCEGRLIRRRRVLFLSLEEEDASVRVEELFAFLAQIPAELMRSSPDMNARPDVLFSPIVRQVGSWGAKAERRTLELMYLKMSTSSKRSADGASRP